MKALERESLVTEAVQHIKLWPRMTVDQLVREFDRSGSFGAGRLSTACDIYERMVRDEGCVIFLGLAGPLIPGGLRAVIVDLIRRGFVNAVVSTGANMVHDVLEALGGRHYKGHWLVDDFLLYKHHLYRVYDVFIPEEDFIKFDVGVTKILEEVAKESEGRALASYEFAWEIGKRLNDFDSILRAAYDTRTPIFLPAIRDSEFAVSYLYQAKRSGPRGAVCVDAFKEFPAMVDMMKRADRVGMVVLGGGVPRNSIQHAAVVARKGLDYAIVITMDRPEAGGLSGSTLEETISWGKVKRKADKIMVIGDAIVLFPIIVASTLERLGRDFVRKSSFLKGGEL